jgi:thiol-disulfide isomerase/thioredoxin
MSLQKLNKQDEKGPLWLFWTIVAVIILIIISVFIFGMEQNGTGANMEPYSETGPELVQLENNTPAPEPEPDTECVDCDVVCVDGECVECQYNSDCGGIEVCCRDMCVECCSSGDCPETLICEEYICVEEENPKAGSRINSFDSLTLPEGICTENGKPIIRLYSTSWCPHCQWIKETYESVVKSYGNDIVAYHWVVDKEDDALTSKDEGALPPEEWQLYTTFNSRATVPTFVFGCKYFRIGTAYEDENDLAHEERDFRAVIDALLDEV